MDKTLGTRIAWEFMAESAHFDLPELFPGRRRAEQILKALFLASAVGFVVFGMDHFEASKILAAIMVVSFFILLAWLVRDTLQPGFTRLNITLADTGIVFERGATSVAFPYGSFQAFQIDDVPPKCHLGLIRKRKPMMMMIETDRTNLDRLREHLAGKLPEIPMTSLLPDGDPMFHVLNASMSWFRKGVSTSAHLRTRDLAWLFLTATLLIIAIILVGAVFMSFVPTHS